MISRGRPNQLFHIFMYNKIMNRTSPMPTHKPTVAIVCRIMLGLIKYDPC